MKRSHSQISVTQLALPPASKNVHSQHPPHLTQCPRQLLKYFLDEMAGRSSEELFSVARSRRIHRFHLISQRYFWTFWRSGNSSLVMTCDYDLVRFDEQHIFKYVSELETSSLFLAPDSAFLILRMIKPAQLELVMRNFRSGIPATEFMDQLADTVEAIPSLQRIDYIHPSSISIDWPFLDGILSRIRRFSGPLDALDYLWEKRQPIERVCLDYSSFKGAKPDMRKILGLKARELQVNDVYKGRPIEFRLLDDVEGGELEPNDALERVEMRAEVARKGRYGRRDYGRFIYASEPDSEQDSQADIWPMYRRCFETFRQLTSARRVLAITDEGYSICRFSEIEHVTEQLDAILADVKLFLDQAESARVELARLDIHLSVRSDEEEISNRECLDAVVRHLGADPTTSVERINSATYAQCGAALKRCVRNVYSEVKIRNAYKVRPIRVESEQRTDVTLHIWA